LTTTLEITLDYLRAGLCVLPADGPQKRPAVPSWKTYQRRLPSEDEVRRWFERERPLCLVAGQVSGNLEMIDFDCGGEVFAVWKGRVEQASPGLVEQLVLERSPSGGWHVVYRHDSEIFGNLKLAERAVVVPNNQEIELYGKKYKPRKVGDQWEVWLTLVETRGEGGIFLCDPTPGYMLVQGKLESLPVLSEEQRFVLLDAAWSLSERPRLAEPDRAPAPNQEANGRPGDDFNERGDVRSLLRRHGWTLVRAGENEHWRRPGKSAGTSATLKDGVFYVFSSNAAPFRPNRGYSSFAVYAQLEHAGDYVAAAGSLRAQGFGRDPGALFQPLTTPAQTQRAQKIAAMPLPRARKPSHAKADQLAERIASSAIAPSGERSEADFAVCCYALRNGIDKEEVWKQVEPVGTFAEQGRRYFEVTWGNAEYEVRAEIFEKLEQRAACQRRRSPGGLGPNSQQPLARVPGGDVPEGEESGEPARPTIPVQPATTPVAETMRQITDRLLEVGGCYSRVEQLVVVRDDSITPVLSAAELAGLLNHHVEFYFIDEEGGEYKPLPASYGNTWLNHPGERGRLSAIKLFTRNPVFTEDWRLVPPGYDPASGIYYAGPEVPPRSGTAHLDKLLREFCFKSAADRTNYLGMLLTTLLIPRFIGSKPAVLFSGNQPELGKSILAQIIAVLRDGKPVETASYNPNDEEFEKRLGSIVRRGATTIIIDNAKGRSRNPRIESACLERSITDPILSFRLLGFSQDIRAENSHLFCLTANSPDVSRDLVTRSVVVNLYYEGNPERRSFSLPDPEAYAQEHRLEILGELIGMVEHWKGLGRPPATVHSRFNKRGWGTFVGGILAACGQPDFLGNAEEAATQLDETRREFSDLVATLADHPQGLWTAGELVQQCDSLGLLREELGSGSARSKATRLGVIAGRYLAERFPLAGGRTAVFHRCDERNGKVYRVEIEEKVRNV
jgi:hypothetical protein